MVGFASFTLVLENRSHLLSVGSFLDIEEENMRAFHFRLGEAGKVWLLLLVLSDPYFCNNSSPHG